MRWQGQELGVPDAEALPGLEHLNGLVRSVTTPEFAGVTFHEVMAKTAIDIAIVTGTDAAASRRSGRSRRRSDPFVRIDSGVPESARADTIPGMSR